jgi:hypothetical protein
VRAGVIKLEHYKSTSAIKLTPEARRSYPEIINFKKQRIERRMGWTALKSEILGINEPLTHLYQYLEKGETALEGIKEDVETDIAERLPKTPFVNYVSFKFDDKDFLSEKGEFSMKLMTQTNLRIFKEEAAKDSTMAKEFERAQSEAQEVDKLVNWFPNAKIGAYLIFESLPIKKQEFAISRIYQKTSNKSLDGCFVSLHNSSIDQFNEFRKIMSPGIATSKDEAEILKNNYEIYNPNLTQPNKFLDHYVNTYDKLLEEKLGANYSFGLEAKTDIEKQNGLLKVRAQTKLTSIYTDMIKTLADGEGLVTPQLIQINDKLKLGYQLEPAQVISTEMAHNLMNKVIRNITSAIDRADSDLLADLENSDSGSDVNYAAASYYGEQAKAAGENYDSKGCPEYSRNNNLNLESKPEANMLVEGFRYDKAPDNFGKPQIGVCRIDNCPTRGEISWWPNKTLVGGCKICPHCHALFAKGKSPKEVYADKNKREEKAKIAQIANIKKMKDQQNKVKNRNKK